MTRRRWRWVLLAVLVPASYRLVRAYALGSHSLETVLGLAPGSVPWHAAVAATLLFLRFGSFGVVGGVALAWPLEEWLLARRARRAVETPVAPARGENEVRPPL